MTAYVLCLIIFSLGIYCVLRKRNILKMIIGVVIAEYAVNLFFLLIAYRVEGSAPIYAADRPVENMVDALPQAIVLTSIVLGLATTVLLIAFAMRIYEEYGTLDVTKIRDLNG
jgi:multicomponent Na+:H+ antiporter subunit C